MPRPNSWRQPHDRSSTDNRSRGGADTRPGLGRLVGVELRKMVDTRAGFWLQLGTLALMVTLVVLSIIFGEADENTFQDMLWNALWPASLLLPVVGILLVSSEWSQRTAPITFALVPRRSRVIVAKGGSLARPRGGRPRRLARPGRGRDRDRVAGRRGTWSLEAAMLGQAAVYIAASMLMGLAFGAALLSSAPAIVLYFLLPLSWTLVASISIFEVPKRWLDTAETLVPMAEHSLSATEWAHVGATLGVWLLLPLAIGVWRIRRSEIA